ncbi:hypothetical protein [Microseira wollei]|uniref:Uncharacterized protein n=1 Tax=Microseira wollei NIES-4236 TaxID=2530354 RepID=A0AAV3X645_9CYAN|nr:hypothetical protein [Microseira wollei]GET37593.1 hypothetical protein MiSe_23470 [Microseira wollei NIES-4236]
MFRNLNRLKWKWVILASVGCLLTSINALAQIPIQNIPITPRQTIQLQLGNATARLNRIETAFNRIERQNVFAVGDSEEISQATLEYAQAMKAALDNALQNAQTLANSQGTQGSITPLDTFEQAEKANQPRLEQLEQRANNIDNKIKAGAIRVDRRAIERLSVAERRELFDSLQAPARQIYLQNQPDLFKSVSTAPQKELKSVNETSATYQSFLPENTRITPANYAGIVVSDMVQNLSDTLIPPAYAAVAGPCVALAIAKNWSALAACVVNAGSQATSIYNQFVSCWNGASGWLKWLKRARCLATLIVKLG